MSARAEQVGRELGAPICQALIDVIAAMDYSHPEGGEAFIETSWEVTHRIEDLLAGGLDYTETLGDIDKYTVVCMAAQVARRLVHALAERSGKSADRIIEELREAIASDWAAWL